MPRSLQWRIAFAFTALILVSMGAVSAYLIGYIRDRYTEDLEQRLNEVASLVARHAEYAVRSSASPSDLAQIAVTAGETIDGRVTIVSLNGAVLGDSHTPPLIQNDEGLAPEIQAAVASGLGKSTRNDRYLGEETLYIAVPAVVDGQPVAVARAGVPTSRVAANMRRIVTTVAVSALIVAVLAIAVAYLVAYRTSRSIRSVTEGARKLAQGDLDQRVHALSADETQQLADAFNRMAASLRDIVRDLSGERNKLSAVLETMADGVLVVGPDGRVELINKSAGEMLQVKAEVVTGRQLLAAVRDHDLRCLVSDCQEKGEQQHAEVEVAANRRVLSSVATPLAGKGGGAGVLLTLHDLTRIRQVDVTRKEFVSNVSHELRTPLASIKAMVETLEGGAMDERAVAADFLARIHKEVDRMSGLVKEQLDLAVLESGKEVLRPRPVDVRKVVEDVAGQMQEMARAKGIRLETAVPQGLPNVWCEEDRLRQVLVNLCHNAIKFTPENGVVTVSAASRSGMIEVSVTDNGIGIAREHLPHIFERYYKVERSRRDSGTGLGLAIAKHIVLAHGGHVSVNSAEGEGSTFTFTVPTAGKV